MITAVDSNVLFDVLLDDPVFSARSQDALRRASREGALILCEAVYTEVAGLFPERERALLETFFRETGIQLVASRPEALFKAGHLWKRARPSGAHRRLLADFLVGAHALLQAERLLTRDKGFYRAAFSGLRLFS